MKKRKGMLFIVSMAVTLIAGCGNTKETTSVGEGDSQIEEGTSFTVGFDAEFPPYGYLNENGEYVGFDLSLAEEVAERNGWELKKQPIDWDGKDFELSSGAIDCIWNGFTMDGREDSYTWSKPYVDNSQVFVVKAESGAASHGDLAGKTVAVQKESSALAALNKEENKGLKDSFAQLIEFGDYNTAFLELQAGSVDAIAMDIGVCKYQMESREGNYSILEDYLATEKYGVGFLKGNEELRDQVQSTLDEMVVDGTFAEIAKEWGLTDSVCLTAD